MASKVIANLRIQVGATAATLRKDFNEAGGAVRGFAGRVEASSAPVAALTTRIRSLIISLGAVAAVTGGLQLGVKLAADMEQATIAFTTMTGSAEQAQSLLGDLQQFAASTPFAFPELRDSAKLLLAFNAPADQIVPTLQRIGDVAAGIGQPIGELAELYGKARVQGRLAMEDINQLTGRGIPIIQELAKQFGVAESEVRNLVSSGKVNFSNLEQAFISMTSSGGKFAGLMEAQSASLTGVISTLKDNVGLLVMEVGNALLPVLKSTANGALALTDIIRNLDVGTVKSTVQITAFAGALAGTLIVIPRIVTAIKSIITALRAMATASSIAQALGGPAGWATLAAGIAAASAAAIGVGAAFDSIDASATTATASAAAAVSSFDELDDLSPTIDSVADSIDAAAAATDEWASIGERLTEKFKSPVEKIREDMLEANTALRRGVISWETYGAAIEDADKRLRETLDTSRSIRDLTQPSVGAAVRGTTAGFAAVREGEQTLRAIAEHAKRAAELDAKRNAILGDIARDMGELARRDPVTIRRHDIVGFS